MIANINHGSKLYDALAYNQNKLDVGHGRLLGVSPDSGDDDYTKLIKKKRKFGLRM